MAEHNMQLIFVNACINGDRGTARAMLQDYCFHDEYIDRLILDTMRRYHTKLTLAHFLHQTIRHPLFANEDLLRCIAQFV